MAVRMRDFRHGLLARWCFVSVLALLLGCAESNPEAEQAAYDATEPWLALMDQGEYGQCWASAASLFRDTEDHEDWVTKARGYRDPLGEFKSRQLNATNYIRDPWGAPPGEYVIVVYDSHWQNGTIYESVHMQRQVDGGWLVAGYSVQQQ